MTLALSTMWSQQERFDGDLRAFAREARELGYDALEISYVVEEEGLRQLLAGDALPIASFHAPVPRVRGPDGRHSDELNLAALDEDERRLAVRYAMDTIDHAAAAGARFIVLHLGGVGNEMFEEEKRLRRLYDSGVREGDEVEELRRSLVRRRAAEVGPWLEKARLTLAELAEHASSFPGRMALGLENRYHYHEIPSLEEAQDLLSSYPANLVGYWHDVGHAEVLGRLGLVDRHRWLAASGGLGPRTLGCHLHDVQGIGDHRAPGDGDVDWGYIARGLPPSALRVFEINQHQPPEAVAGAIDFLRERGVV